MQGTRGSLFRKTVPCIMAFMMLFFVLCSALFLAHEADHNCTGDDCPVCACIQQCENLLHQIRAGSVQVSHIIPVIFLFLILLFFVRDLTQETLITRKIRLNP